MDEAVGEGAPSCLWSPAVAALHGPPHPDAVLDDDEEQTFDEFAAMEREPNAEGTGRFRPSRGRRTIGVLPLGAGADAALLADLADLVRAHTTLPVRRLRPLELSPEGDIVDQKRGLAFPLETFEDGSAEVFSVLNVLEEYVSDSLFAVVAVGALPLAEEQGDGVVRTVIGRACGDRVAVVTTVDVPRAEVLATALHELYHTFGLDHCVAFRGLMNSQWMSSSDDDSAAGTLLLAPHNLRKLALAVDVPGPRLEAWLAARFERLRALCERMGMAGDAALYGARLSGLAAVAARGAAGAGGNAAGGGAAGGRAKRRRTGRQ